MRTPIIAGNWKMHKTVAESVRLATDVLSAVGEINGVEIVLCPTFVSLASVEDVITNTKVQLGAQNMFWEYEGAYTGEVSPLMLKGWCDYVILGHSERREYFGETDETVNKKAKACLAHHLMPIICVGENLDQNEAGETVEFVGGQVRGALDGIPAEQVPSIVIAYEPIWAIGTGKSADPAPVNNIINTSIRGVIAEMYSEDVAQKVRVQYGGSVKPANVDGYMAQPDIDGALVGGASLKAETFVPLIQAAVPKG